MLSRYFANHPIEQAVLGYRFHPSVQYDLFMPCRYVIDKERRLVISTAWDRLTFAQAKAHDDQLLSDPDFSPEFNQLMDATAVTAMDMSIERGQDVGPPRHRVPYVPACIRCGQPDRLRDGATSGDQPSSPLAGRRKPPASLAPTARPPGCPTRLLR